jgi:hypothetical protein
MERDKVSLKRIKAQIDALRLQQHDALHLLSMPERKPGVHDQLIRLLARIAEERARLTARLLEFKGRSGDELHWRDLVS